jgi:LmbE family N-acetylglucosaminyl deacetylase
LLIGFSSSDSTVRYFPIPSEIHILDKRMTRILTVIAHPDDETMLTGGVLALLARNGMEVYYLCATRGEGGEVGEPPVCARDQLGTVREREMRCAVQALGGVCVDFLGYIDPLVGENDELHPYTDDLPELASQIAVCIQEIKPDAVITHGSNGEYGHPAHQLTHQATCKAVESLNEQAPILYTFSASFPEHPRPRLVNRDDLADLVLDITPAIQQKIAAALCHTSQHALFVRRSSVRAGRQLTVPEVIMKLEGLHRLFPPIETQVADPVIAALEPWKWPPAP